MMFGRLGKKEKRKEESKAGPPQWLEAYDPPNPFKMRVLDCRPVLSGFSSATQDPKVAAYFAGRDRTGKNFRGQMVEQPLLIDCDLRYPLPANGLVTGALFAAGVMEDKWDLFHYDEQIYFVRSWTGYLTAVGMIRLAGNGFVLEEIEVNSQAVAGDSIFATRQVDYLLKSHVLKLNAPHPILPSVGNDAQQIALSAFSLYGRRGQFATFEDTTRLRPPE